MLTCLRYFCSYELIVYWTFHLSAIVFELILAAVKRVQEDAMTDLMWSHHAPNRCIPVLYMGVSS
jgi:hypothetical protein